MSKEAIARLQGEYDRQCVFNLMMINRNDLKVALDRIKWLEERLECNHVFQLIDGELVRVEAELGVDSDGIACRDATIEQLKQHVAMQRINFREVLFALKALRACVQKGEVPRYTVTPGAALNSVIEETVDPALRKVGE